MLRGPLLVRWGVENDKRKDVNIPHAIDTSEESGGVL